MAFKYLLDENIDPVYRRQLVLRAPTLSVLMIGDPGTPPKGTLDPDILLWCEANNYVLVTNNRKSMPGHLSDHLAAGKHIPGIIIFSVDDNMVQTLDLLELIADAASEDDYRDRIAYLPNV